MFVDYSPRPETASLVFPNDVFEMQNKMSKDLNNFQTSLWSIFAMSKSRHGRIM